MTKLIYIGKLTSSFGLRLNGNRYRFDPSGKRSIELPDPDATTLLDLQPGLWRKTAGEMLPVAAPEPPLEQFTEDIPQVAESPEPKPIRKYTKKGED